MTEILKPTIQILTRINSKWYSHFGRHFDCCVLFDKSKHSLTMYNNPLLGIYPHDLKHTDRKIFMGMFIITLFIVSPKLEATKISLGRWMSKHYVHIILFSVRTK